MSAALNAILKQKPQARRIIESASLNAESYYARLRLGYKDFAVVCHQRSGSHLLATALDSHPEIACQGELLQLLKTPDKAYAPIARATSNKINGAIIMYNQFEIARALDLCPPKIIHLKRNAKANALSVALNARSRATRGDEHRPHKLRGTSSTPPEKKAVDPALVSEWETSITLLQHEFAQKLPSAHLEVWYEDICSDRDVDCLNPSASHALLKYLGASENCELRTPLTKD